MATEGRFSGAWETLLELLVKRQIGSMNVRLNTARVKKIIKEQKCKVKSYLKVFVEW